MTTLAFDGPITQDRSWSGRETPVLFAHGTLETTLIPSTLNSLMRFARQLLTHNNGMNAEPPKARFQMEYQLAVPGDG